jgi:hypothetical protein
MDMEALAIQDAIQLALDRGYNRVEVESDAQVLGTKQGMWAVLDVYICIL